MAQKLSKAPRPTPSHSVEREYARFLMRYRNTYVGFMKNDLKHLLPKLRAEVSSTTPEALVERQDANADEDITSLFRGVLEKLNSAFPDSVLRKWALAMTKRTHKLTAKNQARHIKALTKNLPTEEIEVEGILSADKKLTPYFRNVVNQNVGLIKSIAEEKMPTFKNALVSAITQDMPVKELSKIIQKHFDMTANKAQFLARDQVGKLNGALDEYHQRQIGVTRYRWRNMGDGSVRGNPGGKYPPRPKCNNHWKLEGKIFSWDNPPKMADGRRLHPKEDYQCRCYAEAVIEDII